MCSSGSPIGVIPPDVYGKGVGGAELALISLAETLAARGHSVVVYNNPRQQGVYAGVRYYDHYHFDIPDVLILFRTPWVAVEVLPCPTIFWSCDQYTAGDYDVDVFPYVNHTVCISPYHRDYHLTHYKVEKERISSIDLGVRLQDYEGSVKKVRGRCIYCSVPDRGLPLLNIAWPLIKEKVPWASLAITSDYRLWGVPYAGDEQHRAMWAGMDVDYKGKIPRDELCQEQMKAQVMTFPCTYEELFCISAAECQVAGAVPVTTTMGALPTTVEVGVKLDLSSPDFMENFVEETVALLRDDSLQEKARATRTRFDWHRIAAEWEELTTSIPKNYHGESYGL